VSHLHLPAGPGVRWDGGIEVGTEVTLFYDPMLAKLIVWAPTRELAIARMHRALEELVIEGVETSRDFHLRVMEDDDFRRGAIEIQWLERRLPGLLEVHPTEEQRRIAAISAALLADRDRTSPQARERGAPLPNGNGTTDAWTRAARLDALR
jgi:acetyl-CoA carboxylase biotin carboxylase subunit